MSYSKVKSLKIKENKVFIRHASSNVFPKQYFIQECQYLSNILKTKGKTETIKEILHLYWSGEFQDTHNAFEKSVRTAYSVKFNWDYIKYDDSKEVRAQKIEEIKEFLYQNYRQFLKRKKKRTIAVFRERGTYLCKVSRSSIFTHPKISNAKIFSSLLDAKYYCRHNLSRFYFLELERATHEK